MRDRGSLTRVGILKELLEDAWRMAYDIKDDIEPPPAIEEAQREVARLEKIIAKYDRARIDKLETRKKAFRTEYSEIKTLFAFGKNDEALKRLEAMKKRKW